MNASDTPADHVLLAFIMLPKILDAAQLLADAKLIRPEKVDELIRLYVKKNPCINEHLAKMGREPLEVQKEETK